MGATETLRDALFGNPPSPTWKPSREGVLAAFSELAQLLASSGLDEIYDTTAAGIAATANGDLFLVKGSGDSFADLYKNVSGSAVAQGISLPNTAYVDGKADVAAPIFTNGTGAGPSLGGVIELEKPATSGLGGNIRAEIQGDKLYFYERGGNGRNYYIDLTGLAAGQSMSLSPINPSFSTDNGPPESAPPSAYARAPSGYEVNPAEGWPSFGYLLTDLSGSGNRAVQTLYFDGDRNKVHRRIAVAGADAWHPWERIDGPSITHSGAWFSDFGTNLSIPLDASIVNIVIDWGQSNVEANTSVPQTLIATAPFNSDVAPYVLMGDTGIRIDLRVGNTDKPLPSGPVMASLVPAHEAINTSTQCYETSMTSELTAIHQALFAATGFRTTWAGVVVARGGYSILQLKQGRAAFEYTRQWLSDLVNYLTGIDRKGVVRAIHFCAFDTDATNDLPATMLAETYVELASAANAMVKAATGQTEDVWFFLEGIQSPDANDYRYNDTVEAQRIASERCGLIKLGRPYYQHSRTSSGSPEFSVHVDARGHNNWGVDKSREVLDMLGGSFAPAQPFFARFSNAAKTQIRMQCPRVPALDSTDAIIKTTGLPGYFGILFEDDSGSPPTITGHSIVTANNAKDLILNLSAAPTGPNPRLVIGQTPNTGTGDVFGPVTGCRTAWYFAGRDQTNPWTSDTVRDWFRPCTLKLS